MHSFEPIAAISTPYGRGGIAVIRLSGENCIKMADAIFLPKSGKKLSQIDHAKAVYGDILRNGKRIDDGIATVFRAPHSYTGEDTVEISCHGGIKLSESVLTSAYENGFRPALGGEFTKRAFLNGKISLSQAEAVIGLIDAESEEQLKLSASVTSGVLSKKVSSMCDELMNILASVYAYIDYPDEDLTDMEVPELVKRTEALLSDLDALCVSYRVGKAVNEGIKTVIVGKPNAGKSSILNRILGYDRAIVTSVPGTTRDTVEETAFVGNVTLRLCDTAGIRETDDEAEKLGVKRSITKLNDADLILAVFDLSSDLDELDKEIISLISEARGQVLCILNKSDVAEKGMNLPFECITVSACTGDGFDTLERKITSLFIEEKIDYDTTPIISNARQYAAASNAKIHLDNALKALKDGFTQDVAGMDIELSLGSLKELDGKNVTEEITDRIFSRFCVGK